MKIHLFFNDFNVGTSRWVPNPQVISPKNPKNPKPDWEHIRAPTVAAKVPRDKSLVFKKNSFPVGLIGAVVFFWTK